MDEDMKWTDNQGDEMFEGEMGEGRIAARLSDIALKVHKIESFSTVDGPGMRAVVFMQGCHFRCLYCHNADSLPLNGGMDLSASALFATLVRYKPYLSYTVNPVDDHAAGHAAGQSAAPASGSRRAGVTFSGGEPLLQAAALLPLVQDLKAAGFHVALDTSGQVLGEAQRALLAACDLILLDIKFASNAGHQQHTGFECTWPFKTLDYLVAIQKPYWIRHVLFSGTHPEAVNTRNALDLRKREIDGLTQSDYRERLEFLPYHTMGEHKWPLEMKVAEGSIVPLKAF